MQGSIQGKRLREIEIPCYILIFLLCSYWISIATIGTSFSIVIGREYITISIVLIDRIDRSYLPCPSKRIIITTRNPLLFCIGKHRGSISSQPRSYFSSIGEASSITIKIRVLIITFISQVS